MLEDLFQNALQHHRAGRLPEAEEIYRKILAVQSRHATATHHLGLIALQTGKKLVAVNLIRKAIELDPGCAEAYNNLGNALLEIDNAEEALASYRHAIALKPDYAAAHNNLGATLKDRGQLAEAITAYGLAIQFNPELAEAHYNLGDALRAQEQLDDAIASYRRSIRINPQYAEAYNNLGHALHRLGRLEEAVGAIATALSIQREFAEAYCNLGNVLTEQGRLDHAIAAFQQTLLRRRDYAEAHNGMGIVFGMQERFDDAILRFQNAITCRPDFAEAHNNLANVLRDGSRIDEAVASYRQAIACRADYAEAHSNLILALHYQPSCGARELADEEARWNQQHAEPLRVHVKLHSNEGGRDRRLRIGYVSPDLRRHAVGRNMLPLFRHHDHQQFEVICYSQAQRPDAMTREFQSLADGWSDIARVPDEQLAEQIRNDRIDILVDLSLHSSGNRLKMFARKPAPVQVTFAGYPGSTGLSTIDYRLSDPYLDPPETDPSLRSEQTIRLPGSFWCFDPLEDRDLSVSALPALENGFVTFGCPNNFCKVNEETTAVWAKVLHSVERSRLLLLASEGTHRQLTLDRFARHGIDAGRIEFSSRLPRREYLHLYHRIDVGLDSFPYNGHTTSLESFWMGVPVVTLVGQTPVARAGWCQLSNLGLTELAGQTPGEFVRIAVELANDLPRLRTLRSTLRRRMEQSALMDAPKFACDIEAVYRQVWHKWCDKNGKA